MGGRRRVWGCGTVFLLLVPPLLLLSGGGGGVRPCGVYVRACVRACTRARVQPVNYFVLVQDWRTFQLFFFFCVFDRSFARRLVSACGSSSGQASRSPPPPPSGGATRGAAPRPRGWAQAARPPRGPRRGLAPRAWAGLGPAARHSCTARLRHPPRDASPCGLACGPPGPAQPVQPPLTLPLTPTTAPHPARRRAQVEQRQKNKIMIKKSLHVSRSFGLPCLPPRRAGGDTVVLVVVIGTCCFLFCGKDEDWSCLWKELYPRASDLVPTDNRNASRAHRCWARRERATKWWTTSEDSVFSPLEERMRFASALRACNYCK